MKSTWLTIIPLFFLLFFQTALGQEVEEEIPNNPPQILTSDLIRKQVIQEPSIVVTFVIVDDDNINEVTINGVPEEFDPDSTILITKKFTFDPGKTLITVIALDEQGNAQEKTFLIGYDLDSAESEEFGEQEEETEEQEVSKFFWKVQATVKKEIDDNPTSDLSSPVKIGDLDLQGVIPDDQQTDNRTNLTGSVFVGYDGFVAFLGAAHTKYDKSDNDFLNSEATYFGLGYSHTFNADRILSLTLMLLDINVGGENFSQNTSISPSMTFNSNDSEGNYSHIWGVDYTIKKFAKTSLEDGSQGTLKWTYKSLDAEKLDLFTSVLKMGSGDSGTEESEATYASFDLDWANRWQIGFKWDMGFGMQYKSFENQLPLSAKTPLGEKRVDMPMRISNLFGWHFSDNWQLNYKYEYTFNLSNKSPYTRAIQGIALNGAF